MKIEKDSILKNICYTELVYHRINKKLRSNYSKKEIEEFIYKVIEETPTNSFNKKGKNYYIQNTEKKHSNHNKFKYFQSNNS